MADLIKLGLLASVFLTVLGIGLAAHWDDVTYLLRTPRLLVRSLVSMFVIMPVICVCVALLTNLPPAIKVALVALAISPVPPFVPRKELMVGGHGAYIVGLLSLAAVVSVVFVPVVTSMFGQWFHHPLQVPMGKVVLIVLVTTLIPLLLGVLLDHRMPAFAAKAARPAGLVGMVLLVVCLVPAMIKVWPLIASFIGDGTVLKLALIALVGTAIGHLLGGPDPFDRRVLALSTSARHPGVAITVATSAYPEGKLALGAVLLYVLVVTIATVPYVLWSKRGGGGEITSGASPRSSH
jgi:BASS family bile acid:Na+ symporter